jgi:hypothetical protein
MEFEAMYLNKYETVCCNALEKCIKKGQIF